MGLRPPSSCTTGRRDRLDDNLCSLYSTGQLARSAESTPELRERCKPISSRVATAMHRTTERENGDAFLASWAVDG